MLSRQPLSTEAPRRNRITAISTGVQRRPIVLVLGMHRSGTSLCSHLLSALGVDMADKIAGPGNPAPTPDNARGHWERWEIVEFHDRILGLFNRDYWGRFHDFALPVAWWADPRVAEIRRDIVAFLEHRMGEGYFGFKDPRMVRLMPVWHQIFNELKLAPKLVLCLRNPAQVARSLHARDGLDPKIGEYRWLVHLVDFFRYANPYDFCTVEYEGWFEDPAANLEKLRNFLGLQWQQSEPDLALVLSGVVDHALRHDDAEHREASQPLVRSLYKLAGRAGEDGAAREQIAYIVSQFVGFQQLQRPFQQAFEDVAGLAAKFPEVESEVLALRAAVGEREAVVEAADARAFDVEAQLADAQLESEQQRAQIAELTKARDDRETALANLSRRVDELHQALQAAEGEAAAGAAALARAEQVARERTVAADVMRAEVATLQALARAEQERANAAEAAHTELPALRGPLAEAERTAREHADAAAAAQAEAGALREALAEAEQMAREHADAATAVQGEAGALREALKKAEREALESGALAAALEAEFGALRAALAQAERAAQEAGEQRASTEAQAEAMRAHSAALSNRLQQAERAASQREAAAAAAGEELVAVRAQLARTEDEARERAATTAGLQIEIASLQGALDAARQVGTALTAAFRLDAMAVPARPAEPRGWRRAVLRLLGVETAF